MYWYVPTLGYWEARWSPQFKVDTSTRWWSGFKWDTGVPVEYNGEVLTATQTSPHDCYPDFFAIRHYPRAASQRFRDLVEAIEPGIHQFFPLNLLNKSGEAIDPPYFLFNVTQSYECINPEKSALDWREWDGRGADGKPMRLKRLAIKSEDGLVLRKELVAGRHMLRSKGEGVLNGCLFFSDELASAIKKARLLGAFMYPAKEE
jgi:hypothetical protein